MKRSTAILGAAIAIVWTVAAFASGRSTASRSAPAAVPATRFVGTIVSLYPDRTGGCVQADAGQGIDTAKDTHCGPFFASKVGVAIGARASAVQYSFLLQPGDEAVDGLLLSPVP